MIFGDTTVYKGKRFEIKQNLIYKSEFIDKNFQYLDLNAHNPSVSKESLELRGNHSSLEKYKYKRL